jgi:uncharacterized protein DUF1902
LTGRGATSDLPAIRFDPDAAVWLATSADLPGLIVEADTWPAMIDEVRLVIPDLSGQSANRYGPDPLQAKAAAS